MLNLPPTDLAASPQGIASLKPPYDKILLHLNVSLGIRIRDLEVITRLPEDAVCRPVNPPPGRSLGATVGRCIQEEAVVPTVTSK